MRRTFHILNRSLKVDATEIRINQTISERVKLLNINKDTRHVELQKPTGPMYASVTLGKVDEIVKIYSSDPIIWKPYILSRVFRIPEHECKSLVEYVKPFAYLLDNKSRELQKQIDSSLVVDVARLQEDKNYYPSIQLLSLPKIPEKSVKS